MELVFIHVVATISEGEKPLRLNAIGMRGYYSIQHIGSAAFFARQSYCIEQGPIHGDEQRSRCELENSSYVQAVIFFSVAFLEATINEFRRDVVEGELSPSKHSLDEKTLTKLKEGWKKARLQCEKETVLDRYSNDLLNAEMKPFDKGALPFQDVAILVKMRNALVHYEPQTVVWSSEPLMAKGQRIQGMAWGKFETNPFIKGVTPFFPRMCMSHSCASWAIENCLSLADDFHTRMGMIPVYDHVRSRLGVT